MFLEYNSPHTSMIQFEVFGELLQFAQDPNSKHLGTTVWDASMVFVKFLEKNCRKGQFSPSKMRGKRVIELGAGCGLAGFGMALLGCDVVATDQTEVLPLLMRNVERNAMRIKQANSENPYSVSFGSIQVAELDWGNELHIAAADPPFDYIIATDVVYAERLLEPLLKTILSLSGPRTTILLGYELRSTIVHEKMNELWKANFDVKRVPKMKMDPKYQHSNIELFTMQIKNEMACISTVAKSGESVAPQLCSEIQNSSIEFSSGNSQETQVHALSSKDVGFSSNASLQLNEDDYTEILDDSDHDQLADETGRANSNLSDGDLISNLKSCDTWQLRRYGSLAARLLQNVQTP
ncbi:uncharacterized protein LOC131073157 isoform X2 [Cryptomeria japonica]|uniref:uncharacterized protein LOC131073157 isoform X2 n=1 Tax=Cryptomeria japonica TaxID=3369 RepID=UPI0025AB7C14|nr:uncharacterized protein LOC131073157 isoform X2 [Cryptomeria japonica]